MNMRVLVIFLFFAILFTNCTIKTKEIIAEAEASSFTIYTYNEFGLPQGTGSGFFIDKSGVGITNYHVLDGATKAIILTSDNLKFEIDSILGADSDIDIIKFKIKNTNNYQFHFLEFENLLPYKGDRVLCVSSPSGLANSFSDGVVSSIRENSVEGKVIQFTAAISPGSSGSAILNEKGKIIAVTKYKRTGENNESLNFGIFVSNDIINSINKDQFSKYNPKFSRRDNFIILNKKSDNDPNNILNAIEFGENGTTLYMSFTNTHLMESADDVWGIYQDINKKDEESNYIKDLATGHKYFLLSSTLGDKKNPTPVTLGTTVRYKQFFPKLNNIPKCISIGEPDTRAAKWSNICLSEKNLINYFNDDDFLFIDALNAFEEGDTIESINLLLNLLDYDPSNIEAQSILGVLYYSINNKFEALKYFNKVIELSPNSPVHYVNRHIIHKQIGNIKDALNDISKAISLAPDQPEYYEARETLYLLLDDKTNAMNDYFSRDDIVSKEEKRKSLRDNSGKLENIYNSILLKRRK